MRALVWAWNWCETFFWQYLRSSEALADHIRWEEYIYDRNLMSEDEARAQAREWKGRVRY